MDKNKLELQRDISKLMIHTREYHQLHPNKDINSYFKNKLASLLHSHNNNLNHKIMSHTYHKFEHLQHDIKLVNKNKQTLHILIGSIYNRPYNQRIALLALAKNISKIHNPELEHQLIHNLGNIYTALEKSNNLDKSYPDKVAKDVEDDIAQSGLSSDEQDLLSNVIIDEQNRNDLDKYQKVLGACNYVKKQIPILVNLESVKNVSQLSQYALSLVANKNSNSILMLGGLATHTKLNGERMFDFIANEKETALEYTRDAQKKMEETFNTKQLKDAKRDVSFIFGNRVHRIMGFLKLQLENSHLPLNMSKEIKNPLNITRVNESYLVNSINYIFNQYLLNLGFLTFSHHHFTLTNFGKSVINSKDYNSNIRRFLRINPISYQSNQIWTKFFKSIVKPLRWIYKHPTYHDFYGLAFALSILSIKNFELIINFKHHGQTYSLNAKPITYMAIVFPLVRSLFITPTQKFKIHHDDMKLIKFLQFMEQEVYDYYSVLE